MSAPEGGLTSLEVVTSCFLLFSARLAQAILLDLVPVYTVKGTVRVLKLSIEHY